jgi:uncharacterized protein with PIN domain
MIVLDSSILVGIIKLAADTAPLVDLLAAEESAIGAPTLLETRVWCAMNLPARTSRWLEEFIDGQGTSVVPFSRDMADVASHAFVAFGRAARHPAKLNFGPRLHCSDLPRGAGAQPSRRARRRRRWPRP